MIIPKTCYDCKKEIEIPEQEVWDGLVARPINIKENKYITIWLCKDCRKDAEKAGHICEEDINIVNDYRGR